MLSLTFLVELLCSGDSLLEIRGECDRETRVSGVVLQADLRELVREPERLFSEAAFS